MNSSPPNRATMSSGPMVALRRSATATRRRSPAEWPRLSLTTLKRSRSRNNTATRSWRNSARASSLPSALDEVQAVGKPGQRVVDRLVGERLTAGAAFGDVLDLAHEVERLPVEVADERRAHRHPHGMTVVVQVSLLELAARVVSLQEPGDRCPEHLAVVGVAEVEDRRRQQLRLAPTEDLHQRAVHAEQPAVERGEGHADRSVLEGAPEPLLSFAQLRLGAPAVGEVTGADDDALDRGVVEQVGGDGLHHPPASVGVAQPELDAVDVLARAGHVEAFDRELAILGVDEVEHVGADERLDVEPEDPFGDRARVHEATARVDDRHDVVGVADHGPEPGLVAFQQLRHLVDRARGSSTHDACRDDCQHDDPGQEEDRQGRCCTHDFYVGSSWPEP